MTIKEITTLRKAGHLQEALTAAENEFANHSNNYTAGALFWRSLKVPWNNPILAKDSTYPIQEEWNISNAM